MKKESKTIKQLITKWLGIDTKLQMLEQQLDTLERQTAQQVSDFEYQLEEKADCYQVDNLEAQLSDCPEEWRVEEIAQEVVSDSTVTRSDIEEMVHETNHELILEMVRNEVQEAEQKNFDYDLVVSQVVRIIVEKLNA